MIYGAIDKETENRHLKEFPLKPGFDRLYNDHTGRFFIDVDPNAKIDPIEKELGDILKEEINKELLRELMGGR